MTGATYSSRYGNSWALVIGINEYKHVSPLAFAVNDANAVAEVLIARFEFPTKNVLVLRDKAATATAIRKAFHRYTDLDEVGPDDRLLVFFAGHGHTTRGRRGEVGFLVPHDGNPRDLQTLVRWDELTRTADLVPAKHIFFLMDACYGGLAFLRTPTFGNMRFMGDMLERVCRQVLTAGKADEPVSDGNGVRPGHSLFTAHLLNALEGAAATEDGVITASAVMAYVYERVGRDEYSHQTPHYGFIDGDGEFIFDTAPIEELQRAAPAKGNGEGERDVLLNAAPPIVLGKASEPLVVEEMKELLSDPSKRIRLDDYVTTHVRRFLEITDLRHFPVQGTYSDSEFVERVRKYEEAAKDLQRIAVLLAKWGTGSQLLLLERTFARLAEADRGSAGLVVWLRLSSYPILYLMYSAGIAALASGNYEALRITLQTRVQPAANRSDKYEVLVVTVIQELTEIYDAFKKLPGHDRNYVPRSEHLFKALQPELEDLLLLGRSYERLFDDFEVFLTLVFRDARGDDWGPIGRFGYKQRRGFGDSPYDRVVNEAKAAAQNWPPVKVGMFKGSYDEFIKGADLFRENFKHLHW